MSQSGSCGCGTCATCDAAIASEADRAFVMRHSQIRGRMTGAIAATQVEQLRPLAALGTRSPDDPMIALIDAHAAGLHILAWNAGRLGDDATLGKTEDRNALVELARLIGYEPRPALSATTTVAFTLDDFPTSPRKALIPMGTRLATVPAQDELPQSFETSLDLDARAEWNAMSPVLGKYAARLGADATGVTVEGIGLMVRPGDMLLLRIDDRPTLVSTNAVRRIAEAGRERTEIDFTLQTPIELSDDDLVANAATITVLGQRAAAFGATAPDARIMPRETFGNVVGAEWKNFVIGVPGATTIHDQADLDAIHADAVAGRQIVFAAEKLVQAGLIIASHERSRAGFALSAKVTRVRLKGIALDPADDEDEKMVEGGDVPTGVADHKSFRYRVRETAIYIETARAAIFCDTMDIGLPSGDPTVIDVATSVPPPPGRAIILRGESWTDTADIAGLPMAEVATVERTEPITGGTRLHLKAPVAGRFRAKALHILGNAVAASHGETIAGGPEILGSGDRTTILPRFRLKRAPLAYVPAANPNGFAPALEVRVSERTYTQLPTLFGVPPDTPAYAVRDVGGASEIQLAGRIAGGTYNVTALYRTGGGRAGLVEAGRISTIVTPVLGVSGAINPVRSEGGSDAETIEALRLAAPRSVRTLDRIVSLADFEAFALTYRGVGKALASEQQSGMRSLVVLTIADSALTPTLAGSSIMTGLKDAMAAAAAPGRSVRIEGFVDHVAVVGISLALQVGYRRDEVEARVRAALGTAFGKPVRQFCQGLHRSQLLATIQAVNGVRAAQITSLHRAIASPFTIEDGLVEDNGRLLCPGPRPGLFAGLLSIDPTHISFTEMAT